MARRYGGQRPTFENVGEYASSRGADAVAMFEAYGRRYYDSQKYEMELFFARNDRGDFAAKTICITKPRQNGKSFAARDYAIWMACVERKNVLFSAHRSGIAHKMFKEIADFVRTNADLYSEVDTIYAAIGYEGIYFRDGSYIEFQTRTSGVRGGTYNVLILDEAQELTPAQQDAILPTVSAADELDENAEDKSQKIYIGTVPGPECQGTVFRDMHDRAHDGATGIWWLEWGAQGESLDEVDVDNVDLWYACNPAMGRRMSERTVRDERDQMTKDGFARERLGWWSPVAGKLQTVIDEMGRVRHRPSARPRADGLRREVRARRLRGRAGGRRVAGRHHARGAARPQAYGLRHGMARPVASGALQRGLLRGHRRQEREPSARGAPGRHRAQGLHHHAQHGRRHSRRVQALRRGEREAAHVVQATGDAQRIGYYRHQTPHRARRRLGVRRCRPITHRGVLSRPLGVRHNEAEPRRQRRHLLLRRKNVRR